MNTNELEAAVATRYLVVNGEHPMTAEDDAYADTWYVPLARLGAESGVSEDELRRLMLANRLPLPSYIRSDGTQMVARDLLALAERAGGIDLLPAWFAAHFADSATAVAEWDAYLSGHFVCLRSVTPDNMKRKGELCREIERALAAAAPDSPEWMDRLHSLVDALDALEPPFTSYDRLRFGGPVSRDRLIDTPRARYPRVTQPSLLAG